MASGEDERVTEKRCDLGEMAEGLGFEDEAHGDVNRQPKTREDGGCSPRAERTEFRQRLELAEGGDSVVEKGKWAAPGLALAVATPAVAVC
uniref:Uncharacterized protein n=1 Tax=Oryza sativa subsp. japonica TaxID=39947 RepID=Q84NS2_ORYSJ|nr:hypothetical protein [Oryza sativa Japonica Group]